jgi:hypothetical protein
VHFDKDVSWVLTFVIERNFIHPPQNKTACRKPPSLRHAVFDFAAPRLLAKPDYGFGVVVLLLLVTWPDDGLLVEVLLFTAAGSAVVVAAPLVVVEVDDEPLAVVPLSLVEFIEVEPPCDEVMLSVVPVFSVDEQAATPMATIPARISF